MKSFLKENKKLVVASIILLIALIYCSYNTFLTNDDLPYMFFYRSSTRITNIVQVIKNQISDYMHINGRFFVHCIVQTLLIFDKNLWSILNPIVILWILFLITKITNTILKKDKIDYKVFITSASLFLLIINYKYIIYWVAGSVNYIWVFAIMITFIYYYLKKGIDDHFIINSIIILMVSILHEMSLVFMIIFLVGNVILKKIKHEKINKKYIYYLIALIISGSFILLSPGNNHRMNADLLWSSLNIFEKIKLSLPVVSKNLFNFKNYYNIIPIIYVISIMYKLFKNKNKSSYVLSYILTLLIFLSLIFNNGYIYILVAIISFIGESYIHIREKHENIVILSLGFYAIVYSTIIVPNYADARPNLFIYIYWIIIICLFLNNIINKKYINYLLVIIFSLLVVNELIIYNDIGRIHKNRLRNIESCRNNNCEVLNLPKMPRKYRYYHIDINSPSDKNYYTYKFYVEYYKLPDDIIINYYD